MLQGGNNFSTNSIRCFSITSQSTYNKIEALRFRVCSFSIHFVQSNSKNILMNSIINSRWQRFKRSSHSVPPLDFRGYLQKYFCPNIESCVWPSMYIYNRQSDTSYSSFSWIKIAFKNKGNKIQFCYLLKENDEKFFTQPTAHWKYFKT